MTEKESLKSVSNQKCQTSLMQARTDFDSYLQNEEETLENEIKRATPMVIGKQRKFLRVVMTADFKARQAHFRN